MDNVFLDIQNSAPGDDAFSEAIEECATILCAGGIACVPTDSVYGLSSAVMMGSKPNITAAEKILLLKERPLTQKMPLLIPDSNALKTFAQNVTPEAFQLAAAFWPGALTLVVEAGDAVPAEFREEDGSVAVRVPDFPFLRGLMNVVGPLTTTSANIHGEASPTDLEEVDFVLREMVDVLVDAGKTRYAEPSTIADVRRPGSIRILRAGAVSLEKIFAYEPAKSAQQSSALPSDSPTCPLERKASISSPFQVTNSTDLESTRGRRLQQER